MPSFPLAMENYDYDYGHNFGEQVIIVARRFTISYDIESLERAIELWLYEQKDCTRDVVTYNMGLLDPDALEDLCMHIWEVVSVERRYGKLLFLFSSTIVAFWMVAGTVHPSILVHCSS